MATYIRRRQQGVSVEDAAIEARDQFLNYDIRAPWVNAARATALPFIAYTYRAIPKISQTVAERPWKVAKYVAISQGLNMLAYSVAPSDYDEEEERNSFREGETGKTWVYTDRMLRMPWLSDSGDPVFLDIRRWVPAGDVFDLQGDVPSWLQIGGPAVIAAEVYLNRAAFTGDDIVNPLTDTFGERMTKRGEFLYKSWMPSAPWVPNSWYQEKIWRAFEGDARQWHSNEPYSLGEAISSSFGVKLKPKDIEAGYAGWKIQFEKVSRELGAQASSLKRQRQRGLIDREAYEAGLKNVERKKQRLKAEWRKRFSARD
ncbi:hypothetical protein DQW77_01335 [Roseovarius sp. TE539]|uniref:hypothetical protein n=1 Tax=Roseovarius sp. TE539 TaxID=2249812 RepID=UPI000DF9A299|nr:hypothetical protein [Roseovarius sp. TE539]RBI77118.1 hypothetical protein DQW77_01335 [Roseovarius sp. TE539]